MKVLLSVLCLTICAIAVGGCASQPEPSYYSSGPGFWMGLVHGVIAFPALILGIFTDVRVYAFPNSGLLYDFGFMIGAPMSFGWIAFFTAK